MVNSIYPDPDTPQAHFSDDRKEGVKLPFSEVLSDEDDDENDEVEFMSGSSEESPDRLAFEPIY